MCVFIDFLFGCFFADSSFGCISLWFCYLVEAAFWPSMEIWEEAPNVGIPFWCIWERFIKGSLSDPHYETWPPFAILDGPRGGPRRTRG